MLGLEKVFAKLNAPEAVATYLIVGLGNPGQEYRNNRHNVGFMVIDRLGQEWGLRLSKLQCKALIGMGSVLGHRVILAKPQTYMNLSGQAVSGLVRFYKLPLENLLVIHDDLDLPLGTIRVRPSGGSAGQKGLNSIIQQLGTKDFPRLRIGIGRPPGRMSPADYVLHDFSAEEQETLALVQERAVEAVQSFIHLGLEQTMNRYNGTV
jgi:PTH1 family peptidyl-tRNA hydrolase